ncbi:MAG: hypothetical protein ACFFBC_04300 [Promethearchaeota archaeon]
MKNENNVYSDQDEFKKDMNENTKKDNKNYILKANHNFDKEDGSDLNASAPFFEIFNESRRENSEHNKNSPFSSSIKNETQINNKLSNKLIEPLKKEKYSKPNENFSDNQISNIIEYSGDNLKKEDNFKLIYEKKLKELEEKVEEYNQKYQKLEEKIEEYEKKSSELVKKKIEYEDSIKEYEEKMYLVDERNEEISDHMNKLKEAREKIIELTNQIEEKKVELEQRDKNLKNSEKSLEKFRFELEKNKLEFERNKLEYEIGKSNIQTNKNTLDTNSIIKEDVALKEISDRVKEKRRGKGIILQNIMIELTQKGNFNSCFLIDGKGMLVSEYSNTHLDSIAIGAMFSLICTVILRAVETLKLHELEYFKISSINGEFILKNIDIKHYERNFILLAHYDGSNSKVVNPRQIISRKIIKKILKSAKKEFYELNTEDKTVSIFDNLNNKINFLKAKYIIPQDELELTRIKLLKETSIEIKDLFEK